MTGARALRHFTIAFAPRAGSTYLAELLTLNGIGKTDEYFFRPYETTGFIPADGSAVTPELLRERARIYANGGWFGVKLDHHQLDALAKLMGQATFMDVDFGAIFERHAWIWLRRRDQIAQTVSAARAMQSGIWSTTNPNYRTVTVTKYDFDTLLGTHQATAADEAAWARYFKRHGLTPLELFYEDLTADPDGTLDAIRAYLHVRKPARGNRLGVSITQQRGVELERFRDRYREDIAFAGRSDLDTDLLPPLRQALAEVGPESPYVLAIGAGGTTKTIAEAILPRGGRLVVVDVDKVRLNRAAASVGGLMPAGQPLDFRRLALRSDVAGQLDAAAYPLRSARPFDIIVISPDYSAASMTAAALSLAEDGVVIAHDLAPLTRAWVHLFEQVTVEGPLTLAKRPRLFTTWSAPSMKVRNRANCVMQVAAGPTDAALLDLTRDNVAAYAASIGAAHLVIRHDGGRAEAYAAARLALEGFNRACLLDPAVVIREGAADIFSVVQTDCIGAASLTSRFPGDFDRWVALHKKIFGPARYFPPQVLDTAVLIVPKAAFDLFDKPASGEAKLSSEAFELGISRQIAASDISVFDIGSEFDFIGCKSDGFDMRFGWFLNTRRSETRDVDKPTLMSLATELASEPVSVSVELTVFPRLRATLESVAGRPTLAFDPRDFTYRSPSGIVIADEVARMHIAPVEVASGIAAYGPYHPVPKGSYEIVFDLDPSAPAVARPITFDIAFSRPDKKMVAERRRATATAIEPFTLDYDVPDLQIRFYPGSDSYHLRGVLVRAVE
jgi:LPS sulfotransferase NodH